MRNFRTRVIPMLIAGMLMILAASCSGGGSDDSQPTASPQATDTPAVENADISVDSNQEKAVIEYEGENGTAHYEVGLQGDVSIPEDYPEDIVPIYPGSTVTLAGLEDETYTIVASTADTFEAIYNYYNENIDFEKEEFKQNVEGYVLLSGMVGGYQVNVTATVNVPGQDDTNLITIVILPES